MARVYARKGRRGKNVWYVDYTVEGVRRRERVGYSQRQAEEALQSRLTDIRRRKFDRILPEPSVTLSEIWPRYLKHSEAAKSRRQVQREVGIYRRHLEPLFGSSNLNEITAEQVESYQAERKAEGRSASTINKEVQLLKNVCKKAVQWGKIRSYQIAAVKPFKEPPGRVRWLKGDEYGRLLEALPAWLQPIVVISAFSGMRRGEVCRLKRQDVDRRNGMIRLEKTKNGEARTVPINRTVREALDSLPPRLDGEYLFVEADGSPVSRNRVSMAFRRACKKAGIRNFRLHDLRHHFASRLTMAGQNQRTLMELLGHKDPKMTTRYQHLSPEHLKRAVECLDEETG